MSESKKNRQHVLLVLYLAAGLFVAWLTFASVRSFFFTTKVESLAEKITPYQQIGDGSRSIIVLGDSIAYGTGSSNGESTIAGYLGKHVTNASIVNMASNGTKSSDLAQKIEQYYTKYYDVSLIIVGANDIIHPEVSLSKSRQHLSKIFSVASTRSTHVIALTTGDLSESSFFLFPLNHYFGGRSRTLSAIAQQEASKHTNVHYINSVDQNFTHDQKYLEAQDHLHLNDLGAKLWAKNILERTNNLNF